MHSRALSFPPQSPGKLRHSSALEVTRNDNSVQKLDDEASGRRRRYYNK